MLERLEFQNSQIDEMMFHLEAEELQEHHDLFYSKTSRITSSKIKLIILNIHLYSNGLGQDVFQS